MLKNKVFVSTQGQELVARKTKTNSWITGLKLPVPDSGRLLVVFGGVEGGVLSHQWPMI